MPSILNPNQNQSVQDYAKWTKFAAILSIVLGVLTCLTIVGAIPGGVQVWLALKLKKTAQAAEEMANNMSLQGYEALVKMTSILEQLAFINKVNTILLALQVVFLLLIVLSTVLFFGSIFAAITGGTTLNIVL